MKNVLITAGSVYGSLDDNKIVSNRARGIWAVKFAEYLQKRGNAGYGNPKFGVTLLVPDTFSSTELKAFRWQGIATRTHRGFENYQEKCLELAPQMDAAILAAAVVNWIPAEPVKGKMSTEGFEPGDRVDIPFVLAPRVIDEMRKVNPRLMLIGCKMTSGADRPDLIRAAYEVLQRARCHAVVANDLGSLKTKALLHPDGTIMDFDFEKGTGRRGAKDVGQFYLHLQNLIEDEHYTTEQRGDYLTPAEEAMARVEAYALFNRVIDRYRERFNVEVGGVRKVFGSIAVRIQGTDTVLMTRREKSGGWEAVDPVPVTRVIHDGDRKVWTGEGRATLNAPLLHRICLLRRARVVLHLHEMLPGVPTQAYAPAGTVRDTMRDIASGPAFNIEGHGFVAVLDPETLEIMT